MASRSLGTLTIDLIAKTLGFEQGMDRAGRVTEKRLKDIERQANNFGRAIGKAFLGIGAAIGGALGIASVADFIKGTIDLADQLDELSSRLGVSTEQLSAWGYAAKLTGSDLESLASTIPRLSKNLAAAMDESSRQAQLFEALGVSVTDAAGNLREVEDVLPEIADRFKQLKNDTTEAAIAQELFGKSGAEFLEFLNLGSDGLDQMAGEARELGAVVDQETAAAAAGFKDELDRLSAAATGLGTQIASQLLPVIVDLVGDMRDWIQQGDLARNITTLLTTAINVGAGAIDAYNNAIDRTSIAIGVAVEAAQGYLQIQSQLATLGFAEGSASDGWKRIANAFSMGQGELDALRARQNAPPPASVPGVDEIDFTRGAPTAAVESTALDRRLNQYLRDEDGKKKATKATKELTEAEKAWREVMEVNALIDDQVQDYRSQQIEDAYELEKAREAGVKRADEQIADMEFERDLLAMTNRERAHEIELRYAGAEATEEQRKKIAELAGSLYDLNEAEKSWDGLERNISDTFFDIATGAESASDAIEGFFDNLNAQILSNITDEWAEMIVDFFKNFGSAGGAGSGGGWVSTLMSAFGFGGGMATGGWAMPNTLYEVNERGLEMATVGGRDYLLTGDSPVEITPNSRLGGGGVSQVNHFHYAAPYDARTEEQKNARLGFETQRALRRDGR